MRRQGGRRRESGEIRTSSPRLTLVSGVVSGILLCVCLLAVGWLLLAPHLNLQGGPTWIIPWAAHPPVTGLQVPQLTAEGITLAETNQRPTLSEQQALFISSQLEPEAASSAQSTNARYILVSSTDTSVTADRPVLNAAPVWLVWYQKIPVTANDTQADPTPSPQSTHDLFVFLDANSGKELFSIWA